MQRQTTADLRRLAGEERRRAARAATLRARYEARVADGPERLRRAYARAAELHQRIAVRQLASARLHEVYAARIDQRASRPRDGSEVLLEAVAEALGIPGAAATLAVSGRRTSLVVAASDVTARAACKLEATAGEGPATATAAKGTLVHVTGAGLATRWPRYGPAAMRMGIDSVTAVPLHLPALPRLGALFCYQVRSTSEDIRAAAQNVAAALTPLLFRAALATARPS